MTQFNQDAAKRLISEMRTCYGHKFDQQWAKISPDALEHKFVQVLQDLSSQDITRGFHRMLNEPWPPTIPEFRSWCEQGGAWLTASEAWAQALEYAGNSDAAITKQAKQAFEKVKLILANEGQKPAARAFSDIYQRIVTQCKSNGEKQQLMPTLQLIEPAKSEKKGVPPPPEFYERLAGLAGIGLRT